MRKLLFILASTATLAMMNPARAQGYLPPVNPGVAVTPGYIPPGPGYTPPGYTSPGYTAPGSAAPSYTWREQRANEDWRNNTWREQRYNEDSRNSNWRTERANEDWRQRQDYSKQATPNNVIDRGYVGGAATTDRTKTSPVDKEECGFNSVGSPRPCVNYAKDKTKIDQATDRTKKVPIDTKSNPTEKNNPADKGYGR